MGKTVIQAKVWYLSSVKHYKLYGCTFFHVIYKGFWAHPNNLILAVGVSGIAFVNQKTKIVSMAPASFALIVATCTSLPAFL